MNSCRARRQGGFGYIWTLMLVAFMGIGTALAGELYATAARRERERELLFIGHEFRAAIERYYNSGPAGQQYPLTLEELIKDPRFANPRRHLRRLYRDPMTGKAEWGVIVQNGRIVGVHSLSVQAPVKIDNFEDDDAGLRHKQRYADWKFVYPHDLFVPPDAAPAASGAQPPAH